MGFLIFRACLFIKVMHFLSFHNINQTCPAAKWIFLILMIPEKIKNNSFYVFYKQNGINYRYICKMHLQRKCEETKEDLLFK